MFENSHVKIGAESEKFNEYKEFDFENGVKLIFRVLNDEPSLRFIDKDGKDLIDLMEFAKAGTTFELHPEDKWEAKGDNKDGNYRIFLGKFNNAPEAILSFLHEAGHLNDFKTSYSAWEAVQKYSREVSEDKDNAYPRKRLLAMARAKEAQMKSERNAWAFAINKARDIERRLGISIFDKIGGEDNIAQKAKRFVDTYLGTYEKKYLDQLDSLDIYTKEEMEKFFEDLNIEAA